MEKAEVLSALFSFIFTGKTSLQEFQVLETREVWSKKVLPWVKQDQVKDHLNKLHPHKSMG